MDLNFVREKKIFCGDYREVDIFNYTSIQKVTAKGGGRSKKIKESEPKQKNLNDKNARRYFVQLCNLNFGRGDYHISATYNADNMPHTVEAAERIITNYLRKVNYRRGLKGLAKMGYILVTAYSNGEDGDKPTRLHHHIIMDGGLPRDDLEVMWTNSRINWRHYDSDPEYKQSCLDGEAIKYLGYINTDNIKTDDSFVTPLCNYLVKQPGKKKAVVIIQEFA